MQFYLPNLAAKEVKVCHDFLKHIRNPAQGSIGGGRVNLDLLLNIIIFKSLYKTLAELPVDPKTGSRAEHANNVSTGENSADEFLSDKKKKKKALGTYF